MKFLKKKEKSTLKKTQWFGRHGCRPSPQMNQNREKRKIRQKKKKKIRASPKDEETEGLVVFSILLHTSRDENTSCKESAEGKLSPAQASTPNNPITVTVR